MNIFITGGTTGIGEALAKRYALKGHRVGVCGRQRKNFEHNFSNFVSTSSIQFYECDVGNRAQLKKAVNEFCQGTPLDLMIANAGISMDDKKKIPNFDHALELVKININGVINAFEAALEHMLPCKQGHLVAISSVAGFVGLPNASLYSASKAFVTVLCESFSIDLKSVGIRTSAICPGFIDTPLTRKNKHPMPFLMGPDKAAQKIMWAIENKWELYVFPKRMNFIVTSLKYMPRWLYRSAARVGSKILSLE